MSFDVMSFGYSLSAAGQHRESFAHGHSVGFVVPSTLVRQYAVLVATAMAESVDCNLCSFQYIPHKRHG